MPYHGLEMNSGWIPWSKGWAAPTKSVFLKKNVVELSDILNLNPGISLEFWLWVILLTPFSLYFLNKMNVTLHETALWVPSMLWGLCYLLSPYRWWQQGAASWLNLFLPLCLKVGTEGSEFCSVCICLLPLLTAVLPALQPGVSVRAGQWDNQMQTSHEGMYSSVQKSKWHHNSLHTVLIKPELNYATQWWQSCLKCVYLFFF